MLAELPLHIAIAEPVEAEGNTFMVMVSIVESEQPLEFVSISFTYPLPALAQVILTLLVLAPEVMVPPFTFHEYLLVVVAAEYDCVDDAQTFALPLMDAFGWS